MEFILKMLKSLRNWPKKFTLYVIRSRNTYCPEVSDKRAQILRSRTAQKLLYGNIIRDNSNPRKSTNRKVNETVPNVEQPNASNAKKDDMKVVTSEQSSEFHWLVKKGNSRHFTVVKFKQPQHNDSSSKVIDSTALETPSTHTSSKIPNSNGNNRTIADVESTDVSPQTLMSAKQAIISAKNLIQELVANKGSNSQKHGGQEIPFDAAALNSMLSYPLVGTKGTLDQTEELLADRTLRLPSISKVLQATMPESSRIALKRWKLDKIAELGVEGFRQYERETLDRGKEFHSAIENYLSSGTIPGAESSVIKLWESIDNSLKQLQPKAVLLEQPILHATLKYKGIIDNVSVVR